VCFLATREPQADVPLQDEVCDTPGQEEDTPRRGREATR